MIFEQLETSHCSFFYFNIKIDINISKPNSSLKRLLSVATDL